MRAETRHQLKQDRFSQATIDVAEKTVHWSVEHRKSLVIAGAVAAVVIAASLGTWYYLNQQDQKASVDLTAAVRTMSLPVRPANMPAQADNPSFASPQERANAAHQQFQQIVDKYPHTHAADFARYFLGVTAVDAGDTAAAEREWQQVASFHNAELSSLAKLALASLYSNTSRNKQAIDLYKELAAKPTTTVSKVMAQVELAATYQSNNQPLEAKRIYQEIQKENPGSQAAQLASAKLEALK